LGLGSLALAAGICIFLDFLRGSESSVRHRQGLKQVTIRLLLRASLSDLCAPLHLNLAIHPKKKAQRPAISRLVEAPSNFHKKWSSDFAVGFSKNIVLQTGFWKPCPHQIISIGCI